MNTDGGSCIQITHSGTLIPYRIPQIFLEVSKECLTYNHESTHQLNQHLTPTLQLALVLSCQCPVSSQVHKGAFPHPETTVPFPGKPWLLQQSRHKTIKSSVQSRGRSCLLWVDLSSTPNPLSGSPRGSHNLCNHTR